MSTSSLSPNVAVIGAGVSGAACAASLQRAGLQVVVFDKSRGVGGRMATRRTTWSGPDGGALEAEFDHGASHFGARRPRFRAALARAEAAGFAARWQPRVHAPWPAGLLSDGFVATPNMPALCRHLLTEVPVLLEQTVQRLQRGPGGWHVVTADGHVTGPFGQVMLAMPPAQAALLLVGHHEAWAAALAAQPMLPCWTLMAVTDDVDWPWDAAEPASGPLGWVARNDRKPGRAALPGRATWVAHATAAWSQAHLEEDARAVAPALRAALTALLPGGRAPRWHHSAVHRWRHAVPAAVDSASADCWWDARRGLGVCGDFLAGGDVEAAWRSGDELADTVIAALEDRPEPVTAA